MLTAHLFLMLLALILFALAALGASVPRVSLGWAGLFCYTLAKMWPVV